MRDRVPYQDVSFGTRAPAGNLLLVGDGLVEDVDGSPPNVKRGKLGLFPAGASQQIHRGQARGLGISAQLKSAAISMSPQLLVPR